jgi:hypothetical protein
VQNNTMTDIASALTQSVSKDGQTAMTGTLNMGSNAISNVTTLTASGLVTAGTLNVNSATVAANGWYLSAANTLAASTNSTFRGSINATGAWTIQAPTAGTALTVNGLAAGTTLSLTGFGTSTVSYAGNWTIAAPSSGAGMTVNGTNSIMTYSGATAGTTYCTWQTAGVTKAYFGNDGGAIISGGTGNGFGLRSEERLMFLAGGPNVVIDINSNRNVTINAPAAATAALTVNGSAATPITTVTFVGAGTSSMDATKSNVQTLTFGAGNTTLAVTNPQDGQTVNLYIIQDGTGSRLITWPATGAAGGFKWPGGVAGVLSTPANSVDLLSITYRVSADRWYATLLKAFA